MTTTLKYRWPKFLQPMILEADENPFYIKAKDKYSTRVILIRSEDELVEAMEKLVEEWYGAQFLPNPDWYTSDTYDNYFYKEMGFNQHWYEANIAQFRDSKTVVPEMKSICERADKMKRRWQEEGFAKKDAELYERIAKEGYTSDNDPLLVYNALCEQTWNNENMFEVGQFD